MNAYITKSDLLSREYRELLTSSEQLSVSGMPLNYWCLRDQGKNRHFGDAEEVVGMPFTVSQVTVATIGRLGNNHLHEDFIGEYVVVTGSNPETGDEYRFGVRDELNFCLQALVSAQTTDQ